MKFDKKDNEVIEKVTDYFEEKYGTAIVVVVTDELEEAFGNEEDAEIKFDEIMKAIGKED